MSEPINSVTCIHLIYFNVNCNLLTLDHLSPSLFVSEKRKPFLWLPKQVIPYLYRVNWSSSSVYILLCTCTHIQRAHRLQSRCLHFVVYLFVPFTYSPSAVQMSTSWLLTCSACTFSSPGVHSLLCTFPDKGKPGYMTSYTFPLSLVCKHDWNEAFCL